MIKELLTNSEISSFLLSSKDYITILSSKLLDHIKIFSLVDKLYSENENNLGKIIKEDNLEEVLVLVKEIFFRTFNITLKNADFPKIKLKKKIKKIDQDGEEYISKNSNKTKNEIRMNYDREIRFTTTIIHSTFHFLFDRANKNSQIGKYDCIDEGLARFGSIMLAHSLKIKFDKDLYLYDVYEDALSDIWETLVWLEKKHKSNLSKFVKESYPFKNTKKEKKGKKPDIYARGYCYFLIMTNKMTWNESQGFINSFTSI